MIGVWFGRGLTALTAAGDVRGDGVGIVGLGVFETTDEGARDCDASGPSKLIAPVFQI